MRVYADTSFLVKLLAEESGTAAAVADYRNLVRLLILFLPIHRLEVANALRQRAFYLRQSRPASDRKTINRERDTAFSLLEKFTARNIFIDTSFDMDKAIEAGCTLSENHTERLGCRGFDLLHVALALELKGEAFLTSDRIQGALARAAGLAVTVSAPG